MTDSIRDILDFWFLPLDHPDHGKPREIWWRSTADFDAETVARFGGRIEQAVAGGLDAWRDSPEGALALILLCDQFPRNCFRKTARAFSGDAKALETARLSLARFGRFPHRNEVLGRTSTPDELVYLQDAKRYGQ